MSSAWIGRRAGTCEGRIESSGTWGLAVGDFSIDFEDDSIFCPSPWILFFLGGGRCGWTEWRLESHENYFLKLFVVVVSVHRSSSSPSVNDLVQGELWPSLDPIATNNRN